MKKEIRIIGFNEGPFQKIAGHPVLLVGTIFRGGNLLEGIVSDHIEMDGSDGTDKIIKMINNSKFKAQLKIILLGSIAMAGFNLIDLQKLYAETGIPVMAVTRNKPELGKVQNLLVKLGMSEKISIVEKAGEVYDDLGIYFQVAGLTFNRAIKILELTMTQADYPEPLRTAKMIATGIVKGTS